MGNIKHTATGLLIFVMNIIYPQIQNVNKVIDTSIKNDNFNGAVLLAKNGKTELLTYTGLADRHYNIGFSDTTKFHIFSLTKTFTAVLIMQLYERGKINLDAPIATYYPEYKGEAAHKATIRNLLTYSSGRDNKDISSPEFIHLAYDNTIWNLDDFINTYLSEKLVDPPGTKFSYNNGDYILLGKIIEKIYKKPFEQVLKEEILVPLKMHNTGMLHHNDIIQNIDDGYVTDESNAFALHTPTNTYIDNFYSAGAMYSTPKDLLIFDQAVFNHTIIKKSTLDVILTSNKELGDVALGLWVYPKKFGTINTLFAERQGEGYGHSANWVHLVDKNISLIILSNTKDIKYLNKMRERLISAYYGQ
ncbi:beta-lactamase family protein [Elizabethkingia anophelis]|uniref:serine hydrolase domain-containing protein n=1 Tax=Elizabethkingia TaxID=308865 RepID=UPI0009BD71D0|nr:MULTISPECIES: serine hydrolase domain-containing protein [Elizabethkingia]MCT3644130.1 beta-lactamase family protein [Elizabethkingia anophelis]MCT3646997.1 beta-lactamase family protein [Elizabethkingia anophelis]MCT3651740.1 beta-lactamase family protein [Elizabethkingia anophelis]MCT3655006.1 beta-lactamase family protein [Elizabethkingia anophelis]MCT3659084.1 beta-lactamase family protein [Elizabethkingia anophelis]